MTRDSILFSWPVVILAMSVAITGYLAKAGDPRAWDYLHWMQSATTIGGIISTGIAGKLGSSPLKGSNGS